MTGHDLWVYGVVAQGDEVRPEERNIEGGEDFVWIRAASLSALASYVPAADYNEKALARHQDDASWVVGRVQASAAVIADVFSRRVIIPFKFGAVFSTPESLQKRLHEQRTEFHELLKRLENKEEWGVKIFGSIEAQSIRMVEWKLDQAVKNGVTSGKLYMLKKQLRQSNLRDAERDLKEKARRVHQLLLMSTDAHQIGKAVSEPPISGNSVCLMKSSYLVSSSERNQFLTRIHDAGRQYEELQVKVSGPWAPYSFCRTK